MSDNVVDKIRHILGVNTSGLTITEIVKISSLSRSCVRTSLAILLGAGKIKFRNVGMAKVYTLRGRK